MYSKEDFITDYSSFDQWCIDHKHGNLGWLESTYPQNSKIKNELHFYRNMRNYLAHNSRVHERIKMTDTFKKDFKSFCQSFMDDKREIVIPECDIYKRKLIDPIIPTIKVMQESVFTHVPIMSGNKIWGVFSENTLFELVGKSGFKGLDESTRFIDIKSFISTKNNSGVYDFIEPGVSQEEVRRLFSDAVSDRRPLEVLFITSTGTKDGDLIGLITIWDITTI